MVLKNLQTKLQADYKKGNKFCKPKIQEQNV